MEDLRENLQIFVRRLGIMNAACCETCCGEQVSMAQSHILYEIRRAKRPSIQQVSGELGMDITTFSRQVKALEEKGLISRRTSPGDGRVSLLELTAEGERVMSHIDSFMEEKIKRILSFMTPFERDVVVGAVGALNSAIEKSGGACCAPDGNKVAKCK